jgi:hypothetical protein
MYMDGAFYALMFFCTVTTSATPDMTTERTCKLLPYNVVLPTEEKCQEALSEGMEELKSTALFPKIESGEMSVRAVCHKAHLGFDVVENAKGLIRLYEKPPSGEDG